MIGRPFVRGTVVGWWRLKKFLYKYYFPNSYKFNSIVSKNNLNYFYIPRKQWFICKSLSIIL